MPKSKIEGAHRLKELLNSAEHLNRYGLVTRPDVAHIQEHCIAPPVYTPERVVFVRTRMAGMSQIAFSSFMNVSVSSLRRWESATAGKHPSGAAAKLLQLVETKGIEELQR